MWRRLTASALFGLGLLAAAATAQPPADKKPPEKKAADKKAADPVDALIAAALANDPDVRMARAKIQLADAELAKARQQVTVRVVTVQASLQDARRALASYEDRLAWTTRMVEKATVPPSQLVADREKVEAAKATLARLETELKLITGGGPGSGGAAAGWDDLEKVHRGATWNASCVACHAAPAAGPDPALRAGPDWLARQPDGDDRRPQALSMRDWVARGRRLEPVTGPMADRIRAALDRPVKLGPKDQKVTFEQALEVFKKDAGLDVPVRSDVKIGPVVSLGEELPVGAWLQLFADGTQSSRFLVREYGLLVTFQNLAPPDGVSVFDFWKKPAKVGAARTLSVVVRTGGVDTPVPATGPAAKKAEMLATAVARLLAASGQWLGKSFHEKEWATRLDRDHLRVVLPDPRAYGLTGDGPMEVVVGLSKMPNPDPDLWVRQGDQLVQAGGFTPEKAKEFVEAILKAAQEK